MPLVLRELFVTAPLLFVALEVAPLVEAAGAICKASALCSWAVAAEDEAVPLVSLLVPEPLGPVSPDVPVVDTGLASAVELAAPVLPVFVLEF